MVSAPARAIRARQNSASPAVLLLVVMSHLRRKRATPLSGLSASTGAGVVPGEKVRNHAHLRRMPGSNRRRVTGGLPVGTTSGAPCRCAARGAAADLGAANAPVPTYAPHPAVPIVCDALSEEQVRVVAPADVGGGFGTKGM